MAKYLLAILLFAGVGIALVVLGCGQLDEPDYRVELEGIKIHTETAYLTEDEGSSSHARVSFSWNAPLLEDAAPARSAEGVIVEKTVQGSFLIADTLPLSAVMSFTDPDTLSVERSAGYRLLLLRQGRAYEMAEFTCTPLEGVEFHLSDTISAEEGKIVLSWAANADVAEYEVSLMTLGILVPIPEGESVANGKVQSSDGETVRWEIDAEKLAEGANYILRVEAVQEDKGCLRSVRGSKLFVTGDLGQEEDEKDNG